MNVNNNTREQLISNPSLLKDYFRKTKEFDKDTFMYILSLGVFPTEDDLSYNYKLCKNDMVMEELVKKDISYFRYYQGKSRKIIDYVLERNYMIPYDNLKYKWNLCSSDYFMEKMIKLDVNYFRYYEGDNFQILNYALDHGYVVTESDLVNNDYLCRNDVVMKSFIEKDVSYFKYYQGNDSKIIRYALERGYVVTKNDLDNNYSLCRNDIVMKSLIEKDVSYFKYYRGNDTDVIKCALVRGYIVTEEDLENNYSLCRNDMVMKNLIKKDVSYFKYYRGDDVDIIKYALERGDIVTEEDLNNNYSLCSNDVVMKSLIEKDVRYFRYYRGNNPDLLNYAISYGYEITVVDLDNNYSLCSNNTLMYNLIRKDVNYFRYYKGNDLSIINYAIRNGYSISMDDLNNNWKLCSNDVVMEPLIKKDVNYFKYYKGNDSKIIRYALESGYIVTEEDLDNNYSLCSNDVVMEPLIKKDISYFKYYTGNNQKIIDYAIDYGYVVTISDLKKNLKLCSNNTIMEKLIRQDINYFGYYTGNSLSIFNYVISQGYQMTEKDLKKNYNLCNTDVIMENLIKQDVNYFGYYTGNNQMIINYAISKGYQVTDKDFENNYYLGNNDVLMESLIRQNLDYFKYYTGNNQKIIDYAISQGYEFTENDLKNNWCLKSNDKVMEILIKQDVNYFRYYTGNNFQIINYVLEHGYIITEGDLQNNYLLGYNDLVMEIAIRNNVNCFKYYKGSSSLIMDYVANTDYCLTISDVENNPNVCSHDGLMRKLIEEDVTYIKYYDGDNLEFYQYALDNGYLVSLKDFYDNKAFASLIDEVMLERMILNEDLLKLIELCSQQGILDSVKSKIAQLRFSHVPLSLLDGLNYYNNDKLELVNSIDYVKYFLDSINVDMNDYMMVSLGASYDWLRDMKNVTFSETVFLFRDSIDYFMKNYYMLKDTSNNAVVMNSLNDLLKNYVRYPELVSSISNLDRELTSDEISKLNYLFRLNINFSVDDRPKEISELGKFDEFLKKRYLKKIQKVNTDSVIDMQQVLCEVLFNCNLEDIYTNLNIYGDLAILKQLKFNNRDKKLFQKSIDEILVCVSMMESIVSLTEVEKLRVLVERVSNNLDLAVECSNLFDDYEGKMKKLYELDLIQNLSVIDNVLSYDGILDKELTKKYGVDVIDFFNKDYVLIAHVKSESETVEELVNGSGLDKLFISLSPISYRNQVYYYNKSDKLIMATDEFLEDNFICSSISNMGTNGKIKHNSTEVGKINYRTQRGVLETSSAEKGNNSEIFCLREGINFKYIVLPGGRGANEFEIETAKKYNLKFVVTQEYRKMVENPQRIEYVEEKTNDRSKLRKLEMLKSLREQLLVRGSNPEKCTRNIAILTDLHGLFEPTLAILEDARKKGITEIYSLGDNIGTGPNPSEVLELLDEYGVKSILGNHELYMLNGLTDLSSHFSSSSAYQEALENSDWTRNQLVDSQIEDIKKYPYYRELIVGGKKILLCHSVNDYNTGELVFKPENYFEVFQGHVHFENKEDNITTVRGAGIGSSKGEVGQAYYMTLEEDKNGGYTVNKNLISYDMNNLKYDINLSNLSDDTKKKISNWTGTFKSNGRSL